MVQKRDFDSFFKAEVKIYDMLLTITLIPLVDWMRKPSRKCKMCKDYADLTFKDVIGLARGFFLLFSLLTFSQVC